MGRESRVRKARKVRGEFGEVDSALPTLYATSKEMKEEVSLLRRAKEVGLIIPGHIILP